MTLWTFFKTDPWFNAWFKFLMCKTYSSLSCKFATSLLVIYYWHFKVKVISFLSLHTAQKVEKTVSRLLPSKSFPAQSQLYNDRETIFWTFFLLCCGIFEQVNDWLVVWCLVSPVIMFWLMFRQYRQFWLMFRQYRQLLAQTDTVMLELFLCCGAVIEHVSAWWVHWCLGWPETVFGSAFLLLLCRLRHIVFTPGPNDGLHFFGFSFERHWSHLTVQRHLLRTCLTHCLTR